MATIFFDMDGTIADLYGVNNWLEYLLNSDEYPYKNAKPLINLNSLARILNNLQKRGYKIAVISWLSKSGSDIYNDKVVAAKRGWLKKHLTSVNFDEIHIVKYGTPKEQFSTSPEDILFDDEEHNRKNWTGVAYDVHNIIEVLKAVSN